MDSFNETDRRNRLMTLDTLKRATRPMRGMPEDVIDWCNAQQHIYQREITILSNWKQFSYEEQCEYAWEFDHED
jgi:hypothetical protein